MKRKIAQSQIKEIIRKTLKRIFSDYQTQKQEFRFVDCDDSQPLTYNYLIKRNKDLPSQYFEPSDIPYDQNEIAIYTAIGDFGTKNKLEEGLSKTYPTIKTIEYISDILKKSGYRITPNDFKIDSPNEDCTIYGHIMITISLKYLNKEIDDILKQNFNACGYYLAITFNRVDCDNNMCVVYQFEPKFQTKVKNNNEDRYLYHVTTANSAEKILKQDFSPSNRNKIGFRYNSRCYFFNVYDKELFHNFMKEAKKRNRVDKNTFNNDFKIITIDRTKCPDITFFTDPNFEEKIAVFTYSNVPTSAVIKCEDL